MAKVLFDRLLDMAGVDKDRLWQWDGSESFTLNDVLKAREDGLTGTNLPYGDTWKHPVRKTYNKEYHMARIIHFLKNPQEIVNIEIDNPCIGGAILPGCTINDGWHRTAAALLLNLKWIDVKYAGRSDVEDYLKGDSDERPHEMLIF